MNSQAQQRGRGRTPFAKSSIGVAVASAFTLGQVFCADWAFAQEAASGDAAVATEKAGNSPGKGDKLEEVTVTARRRSERNEDVPLAVTAITGQTLQDTQSTNIRDILNLTPGVTATTGGAESNVNITIRGLPDLSGGAADPNVAIFIDGVYQSNRSAISIGLLDLLRIEVIKGPVSALYGRNAYAGVINYVTTPPQASFEARAEATYGDYGLRGAKVMMGGPLGAPEVLGRLVYAHEEMGGTFRDSVNGQHAGGYRKDDVLGTLTVKPTDRFTVNGSFYYGDDFFDNPAGAYLNNNCGAVSTAAVSRGQFTQLCGVVDPRQNPVEVAQLNSSAGSSGNQRRVYANSLKLSYDLNYADISTLLGYNKVTQQRYADFTFHRDGIPYVTSNGSIVRGAELFGGNANNEDTSVDLRLASKGDKPLRGAIGVYYYKARSTSTTLIGADGSALPPGVNFTGTAALFQTTDGSFSKSNITLVNGSDRIVSPFASLDYDLLPQVTMSGEARHTNQERGQDIVRNAFVANTVRPFGAAGTVATKFDYNDYRASLRYKILPDVMVYMSGANGTKAGGFNQRATIASEIAFAPETNVTLEVGGKATLFDRRMQVGIALFNVNSRSVQISGPSDDPTNVGLVTKNLASVKSQGVDFDMAIVPIRGLTLTTGVGFANPKLGSGTYDYSNAAVCLTIAACASRVVTIQTAQGPRQVVNLAGLQAPRASKVSATFSTQYNGEINETYRYFGRVDFRYETKQFSAPLQLNSWSAKKVVNLNAGISTDRYRLTAFIKNLTNDDTPDVVSANGLINGGATPNVAYLPQRRTYGITAAIDY